jgi:potassium inwardly-rectifying channel subfamily J
MVGLVFSKLSRPQLRTKTVIFSQRAVITLRNKRLCLMFRIGDRRDDNFVLGTQVDQDIHCYFTYSTYFLQISAKLLRRKSSEEGEIYQEMKMLKISPDSTEEPCIFFVWPLEIVQTIDEESPLYDMSADDLAREKFELLVIMEGTIETSSMTFQAR